MGRKSLESRKKVNQETGSHKRAVHMNDELRVLIVEDSPFDAELNEREIQKVLPKCIFKRAETEEVFINALDEFKPDIIISDYMMPSFDGLRALKITLEKIPLTPFIIVTGSINEDTAVECMKAGAANYVIKQSLKRLGTAVLRAIEEKKIRIERLKAEKALAESEEKYRTLIENAGEAIVVAQDGILKFVNAATETISGYKKHEIIGRSFSDFIHPDDRSMVVERYMKRMQGLNVPKQYEFRLVHRSEETRWVALNAVMINWEGSPATLNFLNDITERKKAEIQLLNEANRRKILMEQSRDGIVILDQKGKVYEANRKFAAMLGYSMEEVHNLHIWDWDYQWNQEQLLEMIRLVDESGDHFETRHRRRDGSIYDVEISTNGCILEGQKLVFCVCRDITERKKAERELKESEAALHNAYFVEAMIHMILSESLENISLEEILHKALNMIIAAPWIAFEPMGSIFLVEDEKNTLILKAQINLPEALKKSRAYVPFGKYLCGKAALTQQIQFINFYDGQMDISYKEITPSAQYAVPIVSGGNTIGVINVFMKAGHIREEKEENFLLNIANTLAEIILRKKAEERIQYLAYYDGLTDLPNRNLFLDRLKQGISRAEYSSEFVAVLVIDIDRFKSINDSFGNEIGDKVLIEVAEKLRSTIRKGDSVARLGNDEFGLILIDVADVDDIIPVMQKIIKYISSPVKLDKEEIIITFSAGISIYPQDSENPEDLIRFAGLALEIAKKEGRKSYRYYTEDLNIKASEFISIERNLYHAIKNKDFCLLYQPYYELDKQKMIGMEALIRWQNKDMGLVSPDKFISVLEDTGMIIEVGEWILRTATKQVKEWQNKGYPVVPVSVNLSLIQFRQKNLAEIIKKIIGECGYYPSLLTLEITESAFMQNLESARSAFKELKDMGVSVSIDDFGTGYSSLAHLKRFPIGNLKIDKSFIREMINDTDSASLVIAIINMAHTLNLKTIAEGIETEEQLKILRLLRCDMGQGFYLCKPLLAEEIEKLFKP